MINASQRDSSRLPTLAIAPFHIAGGGVNAQDAEVLAQILAVEIVSTNKYAVLPRTATMQAALEELQYQLTGATSEEEAKALGQAINADYVLSAEVRSLGSLNMFTASILHVEDGSLLAGGFRNYQAISDGIRLIAELAAEISGGKVVTAIQPSSTKPATAPRQRAVKPAGTNSSRFNSVGISVGSTFATPLAVGSVHGTISPASNLFLEAGVDLGLIYNGKEDGFSVDGYYSVYPYANLCFFAPFKNKGGFYIGAGGGYMLGEYTFNDGKTEIAIFAVNFTTGLLIGNAFNIAYTLRTDFEEVSNKLSVGYTYRFK
jgi:hypothetical protein